VPSRNPAQRLSDIQTNIEAVQGFVAGMSYEQFRTDLRTRYAVVRALEIISEASRRLPAELKKRHPHIDWPALAAVGNVYRHEYDVIDDRLVWESIGRRLPELKAVVDEERRRLAGRRK
jgi:uncharacterized protein with HEPN domain